MAKFLTDIDLRQNQLLQAVIQNLATAPSAPKNGQMYYNTTDGKFCVYENGAWVSFVTAVDLAAYKQTVVAELAKKVDLEVYNAKVAELVAEDAKKVNKTDYDAKVAEIEGDIDDLEAADQAINGILTDLTNNKLDKTEFATKVAALEEKDGELATSIATLETTINGKLDTKVNKTDYEAKVAELVAEDAKKVNLTDYNTKVQALEKADADEKAAREALAKDLADNYYTKAETYTQEEIDGKLEALDCLPVQTENAGKFLTTDGTDAAWAEVTKATVGLANVDNTSDADKPVSTAQQAALDLKANKTYVDEELGKKADKATTLAGYGITDAYTQTQINDALSLKADKSNTYTKSEVDGLLAPKATTEYVDGELAKKADISYVDAKVSSVYRFKGSVETMEDLPTEGNVEGDVYNVKATGENFAWVAPKGDVAGYWDDLGGDIDLTPYATKEEVAATYETIANVNALAERLDAKDGELQDAIDTKVAITDYEAKVEELEEAIANTGSAATHKEVVSNPDLAPVDGVATWTIAHNIDSADVDVVLKESATNEVVYADIVLAGAKQVVVKMNAASTVAAGTYKAIILG